MKKYIAVLIAVAALLCLCGCSAETAAYSEDESDIIFGAKETEPAQSEEQNLEEENEFESSEETEETTAPIPTPKEDETMRVNDDVTVIEGPQNGTENLVLDTTYYTVTIPSDWTGKYTYEVAYQPAGGYFLTLYELNQHQQDGAGALVDIALYPESTDYSFLPDYKDYGVLETPDGNFSIVLIYPTDMQYSSENQAQYSEMFNEIDEVVSSITAKSGCSISTV